MDESNEPKDTPEPEETETEVEVATEDSDDPAVLKAQIKKLEESVIKSRERNRLIKQEKAKLEQAQTKKADELDNADFALLSAKGYEDDEDIKLIHQKMIKWDMPLRDVLKDADMQAKLKSNRIEREMKAATPSSTKRTGQGATDNLDYWNAKYEHSGELPTDFATRAAVINARIERENTNKPAWH